MTSNNNNDVSGGGGGPEGVELVSIQSTDSLAYAVESAEGKRYSVGAGIEELYLEVVFYDST